MKSSPMLLQRKCACGTATASNDKCPECEKWLQKKPAGLTPQKEIPPSVREVLASPGRPLSEQPRAVMEPRFGHDFSRVRVHADGKAAESAQALNALAYTPGSP